MSNQTNNTVRQRPTKANKKNSLKANNDNNADGDDDDKKKESYADGTNHVEAGIEANAFFFGLIIAAPFLSLLLAYLTSEEMSNDYPDLATHPFSMMLPGCLSNPKFCIMSVVEKGFSVVPTVSAIQFVLSFMGILLYSIECCWLVLAKAVHYQFILGCS